MYKIQHRTINESDVDLIRKVRRDDQKAREDLYVKYYPYVIKTCSHYNQFVAQEVVSNSFELIMTAAKTCKITHEDFILYNHVRAKIGYALYRTQRNEKSNNVFYENQIKRSAFTNEGEFNNIVETHSSFATKGDACEAISKQDVLKILHSVIEDSIEGDLKHLTYDIIAGYKPADLMKKYEYDSTQFYKLKRSVMKIIRNSQKLKKAYATI